MRALRGAWPWSRQGWRNPEGRSFEIVPAFSNLQFDSLVTLIKSDNDSTLMLCSSASGSILFFI